MECQLIDGAFYDLSSPGFEFELLWFHFFLLINNILYPPFDYNLWYDAALVTSKVGKRHALTGFDALMDLFLSRSAFYVFILF